MKMKLKIKQLKAQEVRRGWVRMHEKTRGNIPAGSLIKIIHNGKFVRRIVLGSTTKSKVSKDCIAMDEPTREELGIKEYKSEEKDKKEDGKEFDIIEYKGIRKIGGEILYYWNHPDFSLRFSTRIAMILGFLSIIISIVGVIW